MTAKRTCAGSLSLTLCDSVYCSMPSFFVHEIFQARILKWVAISYSRGTFPPRDQTCVSCIGRWILYHWETWEVQMIAKISLILWSLRQFGMNQKKKKKDCLPGEILICLKRIRTPFLNCCYFVCSKNNPSVSNFLWKGEISISTTVPIWGRNMTFFSQSKRHCLLFNESTFIQIILLL